MKTEAVTKPPILAERIVLDLQAAGLLGCPTGRAVNVVRKSLCPGCTAGLPLDEQGRHVHEWTDGEWQNKSWFKCSADVEKVGGFGS